MTIGVEVTLQATTPELTDGIYQFWLDLSALINGDTLEVKIYEKARAADAAQVVLSRSYSHVQSQKAVVLPEQGDGIILLHGWDIKAKQTAGTARTITGGARYVN